MPSRPLSPDRHAITQLHTRIDVEAIAVTKGETDRGAAVARLATLVPPVVHDYAAYALGANDDLSSLRLPI